MIGKRRWEAQSVKRSLPNRESVCWQGVLVLVVMTQLNQSGKRSGGRGAADRNVDMTAATVVKIEFAQQL